MQRHGLLGLMGLQRQEQSVLIAVATVEGEGVPPQGLPRPEFAPHPVRADVCVLPKANP